MEANYTENYKKHLSDFAISEIDFSKNPCKKTATILSNLRQVRFREEEKYTAEYLKNLNEKRAIAKANASYEYKKLLNILKNGK